MTIFIYGYNGFDNTGDNAMLYTLLGRLLALYPIADFVVLSPKPVCIPEASRGRVRFVNRNLLMVFFWLMRSSVFIVGGGSHIFDYGLKKRSLWIMVRLWALFLAAKLAGCRIHLISNGIGTITTWWGRALSRSMLGMAERISVRDKYSHDSLSSLGLNNAIPSFDLAVLLETSGKAASGQKVLGVQVSPAFGIYEGNGAKDMLLMGKMAEAIKRSQGWDIRLFIFKGDSVFNDLEVTVELRKKLYPLRAMVIPYNPDPQKALGEIGQCDAFVGMRYHACLFAYMKNLPLLVITYHPKCHALAREIGLGEKGEISLDEILGGHLIRRLNYLESHPQRFRATLSLESARQRVNASLFEITGG